MLFLESDSTKLDNNYEPNVGVEFEILAKNGLTVSLRL